MKHWLWYVLAIAVLSMLGFAPFQGTDVAKLKPVEVIRVSTDRGSMFVETDTGDIGVGMDAASAFADLKEKASGDIFLETADFILVDPMLAGKISEFSTFLRPACSVCLEFGDADIEAVADFLTAHKPELTLQDIAAGAGSVPALVVQEGRMRLVQ
ncbi:MAG: hypothetical protein IJO56_00730 [Oscillospiraceae bacterium]|nr:hypothetical protein [Oscillospiraceae bacterium]MBQ9838008.1 hypothetical protein [Oscillospiraceae bacterium]